jgi:hypothetical protein
MDGSVDLVALLAWVLGVATSWPTPGSLESGFATLSQLTFAGSISSNFSALSLIDLKLTSHSNHKTSTSGGSEANSTDCKTSEEVMDTYLKLGALHPLLVLRNGSESTLQSPDSKWMSKTEVTLHDGDNGKPESGTISRQ